jgi:uncharacterized protein (TIGR02145 family)
MKRVVLSIIIVLMCVLSIAQVPESFNYQAIPRNASGGTYPDQAMNIRISILSGSPTGSSVYAETFNATTTSLGLLNLQVGKGTPVSGNFTTINWGTGSYYLKVEIDPAGGTSYVVMGTTQLLSVPYALFSETSETSVDAVKIAGNQTIAGNKIFTGTITVSTPVNATDAATKTYVDNLQSQITVLENKLINSGLIVKDIDGNLYSTVKIGNQVWMAENLKTTKLKYGGTIPLVTDNTAWSNLTTPGYCWYNNDEATNKDTYGALYNWYTISTTNLCPMGWHVPTDIDWTTLITYLGGNSVAGGKLKETGTAHWLSPNAGATNETGFTALPGNLRVNDGTFGGASGIGSGYWWSSTVYDTMNAYLCIISSSYGSINIGGGNKKFGHSVRCLKDF